MMKRETLMQKLSDKGVHVVGTTEDFYQILSDALGSRLEADMVKGIWISAESTPELFDYWSSSWMNTFGVEPKLNTLVENSGWYFEWYDPGTMMVWPN